MIAPDVSLERPVRIGLTVAILVFGIFGLWSALAPIDSAAWAPGVVVVKSHTKVVQHLEGGIIADILAENGDRVSAGDPLLVLDDTQSLAQLGIATTQYVALKAMEARLVAERDGQSEIRFPRVLDPADAHVVDEMATQRSVFSTRLTTQAGSLEVLRQRIEQLQARLEGLMALKESKQALAASYAEEVADMKTLFDQGYADKTRLRELERNHALISGEAADLLATISSTDIEIGEARLQLLQQQNEYHRDVVAELGEARTRLRDVSERVRALEDIVDRTVVRSPETGIIDNMELHTVGAVIEPGAPIADIVPDADELIIEAKVSPVDIDRVSEGLPATIRFSTFSMGAVPTVHGRLLSVSADSVVEPQTGAAFYRARVEVSAESLKDLGDLSLVPGMPAEVFIATGSRTFLQYLFKPLSNAVARSFRED